jgi:transposase
MLTVDHYARIRQLRRDGLTVRQIADQLHHSPKTILKALAHPEPTPAVPAAPREAPVFGPFRDIVDGILAADQFAPRKQRHTAMQIFRRLLAEHGYIGSYDQVRRYLQARRLDQRETFIPLAHPPGHRAEADFGHIYADFPEGRRQVPILIVTWSYSNAPFALALPTERTEAILHGLIEAFSFFGCAPAELWWDNPRTVAVSLFQGRQRTLHPRYAALASHYQLTPKFCLPAAATEKPRVEKRVFDLQRQWATPVPQVTDLDALNAHLRRCCLAVRERPCGDHSEPVQVRFERDRTAALALPDRPFDACVLQPAQVDKYQTIRFDCNSYSVPRRWAFQVVTVKGYVDSVAIVAVGEVVASHRRSYGRRERILDPLHYLATLEHKPAALDHAPVYRDWPLPPAFLALRQSLEGQLGPGPGTRQFIRVLQLLGRHPLSRVDEAIVASQAQGQLHVPAIIAAVERSASAANPPPMPPAALGVVSVPTPDLSRFDQLLSYFSKGEDADEWRGNSAVTAGQSEAAEAADDAR